MKVMRNFGLVFGFTILIANVEAAPPIPELPREYSKDCSSWVAESAFTKSVAESKAPPRYTYMHIVPPKEAVRPEITLTQFDSKNLTVISDNPKVTTEIREMFVPKVKQHNPDKTKPEYIEARTYADVGNTVMVIMRVIDRKVAENVLSYSKKSQDHQSWSLAYTPDASQPTTFIYRFSDNDADKASATHLASRYDTLNCRAGRCYLFPKNLKHGQASDLPALTKTSMEMSELQNFKGFNTHLLAELDDLCSVDSKMQMATKLKVSRAEYNKACKMKVADSALPKRIDGLCVAYKRDLRPLFKDLF